MHDKVENVTRRNFDYIYVGIIHYTNIRTEERMQTNNVTQIMNVSIYIRKMSNDYTSLLSKDGCNLVKTS